MNYVRPRADICKDGDFPCIIKSLSLSASRGGIRVGIPHQFTEAFQSVSTLLRTLEDTDITGGASDAAVLVEGYIPGIEAALEGILLEGELKTWALFDKPEEKRQDFF